MFNGASALHTTIFLLVTAAAVVGQFSDARTTEVGLAHGFAEENPVGYWLIKLLGAPGIYALKCAAAPLVGVILYAAFGWNYGTAMAGFFAGLGFALGITNYRLIKQSNPTLKVF
jgi:hypothetical protein